MTQARSSKLRELAKRDRLDDELVAKELMSTPRGRRWVWRFLSAASLFGEEEHWEPYRLAYEKGQRNIGKRLLNDVSRFTPSEYVQMTTEATQVQLTIPDPNSDIDEGEDNG